MQRFPDEIVENILSRLPVKNLLQIKCVCKLWNIMISNPQFAKLQLQQSSSSHENNGNNFKILVLPEGMQPISLDFENGDDDQFGETKLNYPWGYVEHANFLGSCNGLVCLDYGTEVVLWNPSIGQYRILPTGTDYIVVGFGFDSVSDDYKVFRILANFNTIKNVMEVFALKTDYWRRTDVSNSGLSFVDSNNFLNGSLHWFGIDDITLCVLSLANEKFLEVPLPDFNGTYFTTGMMVLDGCICVCGHDYVNGRIDIWAMKEYMVFASWTKLGTLLLDTIPIPTSIPTFGNRLKPLCYSRNGDMLLEINGEDIVKYNMNKKSCTTTVFNVKYSYLDGEFIAQIEALAYVESLVSPNYDDRARSIV